MRKTKSKPKSKGKVSVKAPAKKNSHVPPHWVSAKIHRHAKNKSSQKESPSMTPQETKHNQKKAKDSDEKTEYTPGPEYEEGDPVKGKIDPEEIALVQQVGQVAIRDRRAYLVDQAVKNESANDELNARQVELNQKLPEAMAIALDPDEMRNNSMESALAEIDMHTQEYADNARTHRQQVSRERILASRGHSMQDQFITGSPATPEASSRHKKSEAQAE
jgi:hypothetical protein